MRCNICDLRRNFPPEFFGDSKNLKSMLEYEKKKESPCRPSSLALFKDSVTFGRITKLSAFDVITFTCSCLMIMMIPREICTDGELVYPCSRDLAFLRPSSRVVFQQCSTSSCTLRNQSTAVFKQCDCASSSLSSMTLILRCFLLSEHSSPSVEFIIGNVSFAI